MGAEEQGSDDRDVGGGLLLFSHAFACSVGQKKAAKYLAPTESATGSSYFVRVSI
jgi:hypothetical protein